jgi:hypothetical protein
VAWPSHHAAISVTVAFVLLAGLVSVRLLQPRPTALLEAASHELVRRFVAIWYDFIVGDDWRVAARLAAAGALANAGPRMHSTAWLLMPGGVGLIRGVSLRRATLDLALTLGSADSSVKGLSQRESVAACPVSAPAGC